jgi:hypothetical protein
MAEKITGAQEVWHEGMQRRLSSTLTEAGIIDTQHRTAGPAEEFDIVQIEERFPDVPGQNRQQGPILGISRP